MQRWFHKAFNYYNHILVPQSPDAFAASPGVSACQMAEGKLAENQTSDDMADEWSWNTDWVCVTSVLTMPAAVICRHTEFRLISVERHFEKGI